MIACSGGLGPDCPQAGLSRIAYVLWLALVVTAMLGGLPAVAQDQGIIRRGDAVVTGFAGAKQPGPELPADVHPLDHTYIDPEGVTARVLDISRLGGAPQGQVADTTPRHVLRAREIGHVFGIAFDGDGRDGPPNIYLAATSLHGLQLVMPPARPDGKPQRILQGRPGAAWAPNLFGPGGGPGSIWKVDGRTGAATLFAEIRNGDLQNNGAGLGALAFDPVSRTLLASDLETGLVWRVALDGRLLETFDHGTEGRQSAGLELVPYDPSLRTERTEPAFSADSPETWGFADARRRVFGLAVEGGRLYYGVADGPQVWSVSLAPGGGFGADARREIEVAGAQNGASIGSILFDGPGVMYVAERGPPLGNYDYTAFMRPQEARVLRYLWREADGRWAAAPDEYAVGLPPEHRATVGGVALNYGYDRLGNMDFGRCRQTVWTTGEHLRAAGADPQVVRGGPRHVHGLQGAWKPRVRPANEPPTESWFVDYDGRFDDPEAHGHIGNVAIFGPCAEGTQVTNAAEVTVPVWVSGPNLVVDKRCTAAAAGGRVLCVISVKNVGDAVAGGVVEVVDETRVLAGPTAGAVLTVAEARPDDNDWRCAIDAAGDYVCRLPGDLLAPGAERRLEVWIDTRELIAAGGFGFRNCAVLRHPAGQGRVCAEGGTGILVKKTGPLECRPGQPCTFQLSLINPGAEPWAGPVAIADQLSIAGRPVNVPITAVSPPLGCDSEPAALPFSCAANVALAPGEVRTHTVTVALPGPAGAWVENCFAVADPWVLGDAVALAKLLKPAKTKIAIQADAVAACHWLRLPAQAAIATPVTRAPLPPALASGWVAEPVGLLPLPPVCADGRPPLPSGRCPCPAHAPYNPETGTCGWRPAVCWDRARLTPSGECCPWGTVWHPWRGSCEAPIRQGCLDPWRRTPDGSCCPGGSRWINGACRTPAVLVPCAPDELRLFSGQCVRVPVIRVITCADGRPRLPSGFCAPRPCEGGFFNARTGRCEVRIAPPPPRACPGRASVRPPRPPRSTRRSCR